MWEESRAPAMKFIQAIGDSLDAHAIAPGLTKARRGFRHLRSLRTSEHPKPRLKTYSFGTRGRLTAGMQGLILENRCALASWPVANVTVHHFGRMGLDLQEQTQPKLLTTQRMAGIRVSTTFTSE